MIAAVLLAVAGATYSHATAAAEPTSKPAAAKNHVRLLSAYAKMQALLYSLQIKNGDWQAASTTSDEALAELDATLPLALAQAKGKADLTAAIKAFYVAAKSYFRDGWPDSGTPAVVASAQLTRLEATMNQAADMLDVEATAAGVK
jgi:hypothetical protein